MGNGISKGTLASYEISVKTGDQIGDGTDANVYIILHGNGTKTNEQSLDKCFKNDFKRGNIDRYFVNSEVNILEVQRIELWRDNCGLLTNCNEMDKKENHRYFFNNIDTYLPQNDPFKEMRISDLQTIQKEYQLQVKIPGLPAQVRKLPEDEKFSINENFRLHYEVVLNRVKRDCVEMLEGNEWEEFDDIKKGYTAFGHPRGSQYFNDDASFGRQRLNGLNPSLLTLCTRIPENFGVTEDMIILFLEGKTMKQAMDSKRLFIIDLAILEDCPTQSKDLVMACPFALFYFNDGNCLMPIAIQLFQQNGPSNPVFLPSDPEYTWMLAKMWYSLADSTYHQAITHLNFTHLIMEGISVAVKRQLAHSHPILKLLNPHFMYLMAINSLALGTLINSGGIIDKTSNAGIIGHFHLMKKSTEWWRLDLHGTLPEDLKSRGVLDPSILTGVYHMRDDALLLYDAIKTYVEKYVLFYYSTESSLTADYELQNWGAELVKSREEGGVGILGVPNNGKFVTTDQLTLTLTAIIYTCSVGHASVNFQQYDEYGSPFNYPYALSGDPPKDKASTRSC
ncbi:ALOX5 [Mytilus coruscus]|uniref:ALOX5 n=1 Tax=Mytilus coruscus TaxID=42192 RepID=A0A6J8AH02_MYTCO|nr:ALOX5 [Mytilus coruscus]